MKKIILFLFLLGFISNVFADEVESNLLKLKSVNSCKGCDLSGAIISTNGYIKISHANLEGATLINANLEGGEFPNSNFESANLTGANLKGTYLKNVNFIGANLTGAILIDADLTGANLTGAILKDADLTGAKFENANLKDATGCNKTLWWAYRNLGCKMDGI